VNLSIETVNLGKRYGDIRAVEDLSMQVTEGEIYAFLGLNGAGKTTTIRMLLGMIRPTTGYARVLQTRIRPGVREPWESVGYLVEVPHSYPELSVCENMEVVRRLHPGTPGNAVGQMIERMGLEAYASQRAGTLSHGNSQRLGIAKALLHQPRLLILDEPASGLDPAGIVEMRQLLLELARERGVTIFMSSHILAEVSRLAQRIGIIHHGRLLKEMSIEELERNRKKRLIINTRDNASAMRILTAAGYPAKIMSDASIELTNEQAIVHPDDINSVLVKAGTPPMKLLVEEEDLEQYFLRLVAVNKGAKDG